MKLGNIQLEYDRSPNFFKLLQCQGHIHRTILARHSDGKLMGFFSFSIEKKWFSNIQENCAYIGDFRTDGSREAALLWRQAYGKILNAIALEYQCRHFLTAILKKNSEALINLTRKKKFDFEYVLQKEVNMINLYFQKPWRAEPKLKNGLRLKIADEKDRDSLVSFMNAQGKDKYYYPIFDNSDNCQWFKRATTWQDFALEKFLIIEDESRNILACTQPWSPDFSKRMIVTEAPIWLRYLLSGLKRLGLSVPNVGESLNTIYLTHLYFSKYADRSECLKSFIHHVFRSRTASNNFHFLSFSDEFELYSLLENQYILQRVPVLLFEVKSDNTEILNKVAGHHIQFEMSLV
jgi:hypothetical protein